MITGVANLRRALAPITQMLAGHGIVVTQQGSHAFAEADPRTGRPKRINIPNLADDADELLIDCMQGYIDHEAAHVIHTDWDVVGDALNEGIGVIHNILEDTYIERCMGLRFPGCAWNLRRLHELFVTRITPTLLERAGGDADARFGILLVPAARAMAGQEGFVTFMSEGGHWDGARMRRFIDRLGSAAIDRMPFLGSSAECLQMARVWADALAVRQAPEMGPSCEPQDEAAGSGGDTGRDRSKRGRDAASDAVGRTGLSKAARQGDLFADPVREVFTAAATALQATTGYRVFTKDFDRFGVPRHPQDYQDSWLVELDDLVAAHIAPMQREIERMMAARSLVMMVPGLRRGRLDPAGLHRLAVDDDRVFRRRVEERSTATALSLLVDNSGSMAGQQMTIAMAAAYALAQTAERVGLATEVSGYTTGVHRSARGIRRAPREPGATYSRSLPLDLRLFKGFNERMTAAVRQRFAVMAIKQPGPQENIDGESLEAAAIRILARPEPRKVIFVLSDGDPRGGNSSELAAHLIDTVAAVTASGVDLVGIGIQSRSVERFYPRHVVLDRLSDLPGAVLGQLRDLLSDRG